MARLDRLGPAKEVAQIAATIGRQFAHALLAAVAPAGPGELDLALARLDRGEPRLSAKSRDRADLQFQARADPRRRLRQPAARPPPRPPRAHRAHTRRALSRTCRRGAGNSGAPLQPRRSARARLPLFRARRRPGRCPFGLCRSSRSFRCRACRKPTACRRGATAINANSPSCSSEVRRCSSIKACKTPKRKQNYQRAYEIAAKRWTTITRCSRRCGECGFAPICSAERPLRATGPKSWSHSHNDPRNDELILEAIHCRWSTSFFRGDVLNALADGLEGIKHYDPRAA